jgi:adenosylhomocysteine nucleosidase
VVVAATGAEHVASPLGPIAPRGTIVTGDDLTGADDLEHLRAAGYAAIDMETAAIAAVCEARGVPWTAFRALSDFVGDGGLDEELLTLAGADGTPKPAAGFRYFVTHPSRIPAVFRLGRDSLRAITAAARAAQHAIASPSPVS